MDLKISICFIIVRDKDEALAFYRDVLGFEVRADVQFEHMRWVTLGSPTQPGVELGLTSPGDFPHTPAADQEALHALMAKGLLNATIFVTEDCDATFEKIRASGAEVVQEPIDQAYGVRDCAFRDPSGNMVRFSQYLSS